MNTFKTSAKLIMLLLSAAVVLSSCSSGAGQPVNIPKVTASPIVSTPTPAATENSAAAIPQTPSPSTEMTYILNTRTKKFHYPSCPSVDDIKENNKREFTGTRDEVITQKYVPCKRCNP